MAKQKKDTGSKIKQRTYLQDLKKNWNIYLFLAPAVIITLIFAYVPMGGLIIAFKDYNIFGGSGPINAMFTSDWVGLDNFRKIMANKEFWIAFKNTLSISILKLIFVFPTPVILAVMLNEVRNRFFQKKIQTVLYLPHFLSWVVVGGIFFQLLGVYGPFNSLLMKIGILDQAVPFWQTKGAYRPLIILTDIWKSIGWSSIIYLAAITGIDTQIYEAAEIDGARKFQQIHYITLPSLLPTISMMFIIALSGIMDAGFDQIFNTYSVYVYDVGDIIGTYVYRLGMGKMQYSVSTAMGLFNSVIAFILMFGGNFVSRKFFNKGIW